ADGVSIVFYTFIMTDELIEQYYVYPIFFFIILRPTRSTLFPYTTLFRSTPLNLALGLQKNGVNIIGTSPQNIEVAEDRKLFAAMLHKLDIPQPPNGLACNEAEGLEAAQKLGYPVLVRPSFVLGGRAMQIVYSDTELQHYMRFAVEASPERPVLVDQFLEDATEVDVDCITDVGHFPNPEQGTIVIGGLLEHIE